MGRTNRFSKGTRFIGDAEAMAKKRGHQPGPGTYENTGTSTFLSNQKRPTYGHLSKAGKETYIDRLCKTATVGPPCSKYAYTSDKAVTRNKLEKKVLALEWKEAKTVSRKDPKKVCEALAPNHYAPNWRWAEPGQAVSAFSKEKPTNFIDMNTRSKFAPAPGTYSLVDLKKLSRGTKLLQVSNLGRGALSGVF